MKLKLYLLLLQMIVLNIEHLAPIGKSDHDVIKFTFKLMRDN